MATRTRKPPQCLLRAEQATKAEERREDQTINGDRCFKERATTFCEEPVTTFCEEPELEGQLPRNQSRPGRLSSSVDRRQMQSGKLQPKQFCPKHPVANARLLVAMRLQANMARKGTRILTCLTPRLTRCAALPFGAPIVSTSSPEGLRGEGVDAQQCQRPPRSGTCDRDQPVSPGFPRRFLITTAMPCLEVLPADGNGETRRTFLHHQPPLTPRPHA